MKVDETLVLSINEAFDSIKIYNRDKIIYNTKKNDSQSVYIELKKFRLGKNNIKVVSYYKNTIKSKDINFIILNNFSSATPHTLLACFIFPCGQSSRFSSKILNEAL